MSDARSVAIDRAATIALRPGDPVSGIVRTVQEAVLSTIDAYACRRASGSALAAATITEWRVAGNCTVLAS